MPISIKMLQKLESVKDLLRDRDAALSALNTARSALLMKEEEVAELKRTSAAMDDVASLAHENRRLLERIAELEQRIEASPVPGTEVFDLRAAERQRERMRALQPYLPKSTAGVFSYSQHQQELFALEYHNFKRDGYFVEVGVASGREYSNTYLLEKYFGWQGILCEPNPFYADAIRSNRSAILDTRAGYSATGETVNFLCVPGIYGLLSTISDYQTSDQHNRWGEQVEVQTVSLDDLLIQHCAPSRIDYLSLDTEGSETSIIEKFDFRKWDIAVLTIEHNLVPGRVETFDAILAPFGYKRVLSDVSAVDGWYIKQ